MHIITKKRIAEAKRAYPESASALDGWYRIIDKVGDLYVFDIGGNKLRLIASIHFNRQKLYIRRILSHKKYNKGSWRK